MMSRATSKAWFLSILMGTPKRYEIVGYTTSMANSTTVVLQEDLTCNLSN